MSKKIISTLLAALLSVTVAYGAERHLKDTIWDPIMYIQWVAIFLAVITVVLILLPKSMEDHHKTFLFYLIAIPVMLSTLYLGGATIYGNLISETKGPIHWHADYQVWYCGEQLDLINPNFPANKIGTPLFHEHNDDRMHVEGTVSKISELSLSNYFEVLGGSLGKATGLTYPTEDRGVVVFTPGQTCPNGQPAVLNVYINGERTEDYENYIIYPHALVPPGDCIIYEVGPYQEETPRICTSWEANGWTYQNFEQQRGES